MDLKSDNPQRPSQCAKNQKSAEENGRRESESLWRPTEKPPELLIRLTISPCPALGSTGNGKFGWF